MTLLGKSAGVPTPTKEKLQEKKKKPKNRIHEKGHQRNLRYITNQNVCTLFRSQFKCKTLPQMNVLYYLLICSPKVHSKT